MIIESYIKITMRADYYQYGINDAKNGVFDTSYINRSEDARMSYMAGWSSVALHERINGDKPHVI